MAPGVEHTKPTTGELADLSALADGTLDPSRRAAVEAHIAASPELSALYEREQRVVAALHQARSTDRAPASLRARIERRLRLPRGVAVTTTTVRPTTVSPAVAPGGAIPYLAVRGAREALAWYVEHLGAEIHGEPIVMPDDRIGHAELALCGGAVYLADEHPEIGVIAPSRDAAAVIANLGYRMAKGCWEQPSPTVWPPPHSYRQIRALAGATLPGVRYRRHLLWRYSPVWVKPAS